MTLPDLKGLLAALTDGQVRFVVVGGVAVAAHEYVRATEDVDIVPDPGHDNLDALVNTLIGLDATLALEPKRALGPDERRTLRRGHNLSVSTSRGDLDVLLRMPGVPPYDELAAHAISVAIAGVEVSVCSREHLIAMKRARASAIDRADLERIDSEAQG